MFGKIRRNRGQAPRQEQVSSAPQPEKATVVSQVEKPRPIGGRGELYVTDDGFGPILVFPDGRRERA
ncbi:MAG TPA: hypothetical protein VLB73_01760 [Patescibacteria group bacterium]|nr:hypothetical protein [Patescibacteria group bacterium]